MGGKVRGGTVALVAGTVTAMVVALGACPVQADAPALAARVAKAAQPKPKVTKLKPTRGPIAGGTKVKVKGTNLTRVKKVTFGGKKARIVQVENPRKIIVIAPRHAAGVVNVVVKTRSGTSRATRKARFTYVGPVVATPVVTALRPSAGPEGGGTTVDISGTGLTGATAVSFGGSPATSFTVESPTLITAVSPAHAPGAVPVVVTTAGGTSAPVAYTYEEDPPATPPVVLLVSPLTGTVDGGTAVTITGTGLTGATAVSFGGTAATSFTVDSDTAISAVTPAHAAGVVDVAVTTPAGTSIVPGLFTFSPLPALPPVVVLVVPPIGSPLGGTAVTITGTGFSGATAVSFGGTAATSFTVDSDLSISAVAPPHAIGPVTVSVTTPAGTSTVPGLFVYLL